MPNDPPHNDSDDPYGRSFDDADYPVPRDEDVDNLPAQEDPAAGPPTSHADDELSLPETDPATDPSAPATPPPAFDPFASPQQVHITCRSCGYNLTGVAIGGVCPECGSPVDDSLFAAGNPQTSGSAVASMVLGITSIPFGCCCFIGLALGIIGLCLGIAAINQTSNGSYTDGSRGMAIGGIVCSSIGIVLGVLSLFAMFL